MRRKLAVLAVGVLPFTAIACDDDNDGNIDTPDIDTPDVDPGEGTGLPGDDLEDGEDDG